MTLLATLNDSLDESPLEKPLVDTDAQAYFEKGQELKSKGELKKAIKNYESALKLNPSHGWAMHCLAQSHSWNNNVTLALEYYKRAIENLKDSEKWVSHSQIAEVYLAKGDYLAAIQNMEAAVGITAGNAELERALESIFTKAIEEIASFFDIDHYSQGVAKKGIRNCRISSKEDAAKHFLESGAHININPHWIFDVEYIQFQLLKPLDVPFEYSHWLFALIERGNTADPVSPSCTYDLSFTGKLLVQKEQLAVFKKFLSDGCTTAQATSPIFDPQYYQSQLGATEARESINAHRHLLEDCGKLNVDPHPVFHCEYYLSQTGELDLHPLRHYLMQEGFKDFSPNPMLHLKQYQSVFPRVDLNAYPALIHLTQAMPNNYALPESVDVEFYTRHYKKQVDQYLSVHVHIASQGIRNREFYPFEGFSDQYVSRTVLPHKFPQNTECFRYFASGCHKRRRLVVVSHSATRTGAPLIALEIVKKLSANPELELMTIVLGDGPLIEDFNRYSHTLRTKDPYGADINENKRLMSGILANQPILVISNSAESRHFTKHLSMVGVPVMSLVHEIADHYNRQEWNDIFDISDSVIFPSQYCLQKSDKKLADPSNESVRDRQHIIPQGLLTDNFARFDVANKRKKTRADLSIEESDFLVLGCGTVDLRKGTDLFIECAIRTLSTNLNKNVQFIWVGKDNVLSDNENFMYWKLKNCPADVLSRIHFIGEVQDTEPYFCAADLFLLASRSDPFPCVMHEALSAGLPIVYMNDSGGADEMITTEIGISIAYENVDEMVDAVKYLASNIEIRQEMSSKCKEHVDTYYKYDSYIEKLASNAVETMGVGDFWSTYSSRPAVEDTRIIYFLSPDWGISGVNSFTETLVNQLVSLGYDARILFTRGRATFSDCADSVLPDAPFQYLHTHDLDSIPDNVWNALSEYFRHHEPCIVVPNYDYVASSLSGVLPSQVGIVGIAHSDDMEHYEHVYRLGSYWNAIVAVSDCIAGKIAAQNPLHAENLTTIRYGISDSFIEQPIISRDMDDAIKLVYTGRLVKRQKRIERYVDLVKELEDRGENYTLDVVGDGEEMSWLKSQLADSTESGCVTLHGRLSTEALIPIVDAADYFVLLSDFEGLPISMLEAMARECVPVVYAMESGVNEVLQPGKNGYIINDRKISSVVDTLLDPSARKSIKNKGKEARKTILSNSLTSEGMAGEYEKLFDRVFKEILNKDYVRKAPVSYGASRAGLLPPAWIN